MVTRQDKAEVAAKAAISSPLLETSITGSRGIIINFTSSPDIGLDEIEYAASIVGQEAHPDANIIWGVSFNTELEDEMRVTVIATGFDADKAAEVKTVKREAVTEPEAEEKAESGNSANDVFDDVIGMLKRRDRKF